MAVLVVDVLQPVEIRDHGIDIPAALLRLPQKALLEFQPAEGTQTTIAAGTHLSVWPSQITPDYNGYVNIAGAVNGVAYEVVDKEGNAVATLGMAADGRFQWNCAGTDGNRLQPGRYSIRRSGVEESHPIVILE